MAEELIIYCDESVKRGRHYSNFYAGALVRSCDIESVKSSLDNKKRALNLFGEVKWSKITENYESKYIELLDTFFSLVAADKVKVRVMFTQNIFVPQGLTKEQLENEYFLLYYQFIKHAFGLQYANNSENDLPVRIYFDKLPDTKEKNARFKSFITSLTQNPKFREADIKIESDQIADVTSHDHVILQCVDIVCGAMQFRLNDLHKEKPAGSRIRGKRTRAKERVYKSMLGNIRAIYPNFNIGISTGMQNDAANRWRHPYRHWLFKPSKYELAEHKSKKKK